MEIDLVWKIFLTIAFILLVLFWKGRNAVWGGFTGGAIIGLLIALIFMFKGEGFDWYILGKGAAVGTILGFISELFGKISDSKKRLN